MNPVVSDALKRWDLPESCRDSVKRALFLYNLLRGNGDILGVGYIWMHERSLYMFTRRDDGWIDLDSVCVQGHKIKQKASAVDRIPRLFYGDLFLESEVPIYLYQRNGDSLYYYTFGWCSEIEMAYVVAIRWFGIKGRVVFVGDNHVNTAVSISNSEFLVDNSFGLFMNERWDETKPYPPELAGNKEILRLSAWYNARAREASSESYTVGPVAQKRIRAALGLK